MLETIRQYGAERLEEAGEQLDAARRHREHYADLLRRAAAEEEGPDQAEWSARVRIELDNVRARPQSALHENDGAALIELTCGTGNTWTRVGRSSEHRRWLEEAIARAPERLAAARVGAVPARSHRHVRQRHGRREPTARCVDPVVPQHGRRDRRIVGARRVGVERRDGKRSRTRRARCTTRASRAGRSAGADGARFSMEYGLAQYMTARRSARRSPRRGSRPCSANLLPSSTSAAGRRSASRCAS